MIPTLAIACLSAGDRVAAQRWYCWLLSKARVTLLLAAATLAVSLPAIILTAFLK